MARIVVVGSGVVGQATGKGFAEKGHAVRFVDIDPATIEKLRSAGLVAMTASEVDWDDVDIVMLAVLTPTVDGRVVLDYIEAAALDVGRGLATTDNFVTVVVRSTVPPTTTEKHIAPILERASSKQLGLGFGLAMNPEFLRAASNEQDFARPWITVVGAYDARTAATMDELYRPFGAAVVHCTPTEAEMIKYVNNVYNAVKISYFNEVHAICAKVGLDGHLVGAAVSRSAEGMWNPLYGTRGGVPYGGACLPKDTEAFLQFARGLGVGHLMLESTIEVNRRLESSVPAVPSPDKIDAVLDAVRRRGGALEEPEELLLEVGKSAPTIL
ncbi:GDP-mannose 6-dehydrogenase [Colletotrichum higginsianum]|uniref:GDP-mannose 6-dehydrogenase n=1 Tax=Colletotrichum higginsianum TaxID=80884 RepID=A0A4T0VF18_9PEZI|nr:GDP-mannose 6-dehydrogenase [Colletotrichum higginsianum]